MPGRSRSHHQVDVVQQHLPGNEDMWCAKQVEVSSASFVSSSSAPQETRPGGSSGRSMQQVLPAPHFSGLTASGKVQCVHQAF